MDSPDTIRKYWFGCVVKDTAVMAAERARLWWSKSPQSDAEIRQLFESSVIKAGSGELDHWASNARDRLALILLTDQFPRTIYRGLAKAFALDSQALALSRDGIDAGFDLSLRPLERVFFYMPLEHSESLADQDRSFSLFRQLVEQVGPDHKPTFQEYLDFAVRHRDIINRFGRFPHRNEALARVSTLEELTFLKQPGASF